MLDDVKMYANGKVPVEFYGRLGGMVPFPEEILTEIKRISNGQISPDGDSRATWIERLKQTINGTGETK
jgi:2-oxoglutarate ferredoxin oxidoreductase subunit alpha